MTLALRCSLLAAALLCSCACAGTGAEGDGAAGGPTRSDEEVVAALRERSARLRALEAVIAMTYDDGARSGTCDAVFLYRAPRELRLQAYKDLVVSDRQLFDLLLTPGGYALDTSFEDPPVHARGPLARFPAEHPFLAGVYWAGEALFLPGAAAPGAEIRVLARRPDAIRVETRLASGARAEWDLDPTTLRVARGFVDAPPLRVQLGYSDYGRTIGEGPSGALDLPRRVSFRAGDTRMRVDLRELSLDPEFVPEAFRAP
ncbi:MAG: hypothetical protein AB7N76_10410 [Planctomycetota bacterium]